MKLPSWRHKDRAAAGAVEAEPVAAEPQTITLDLGQLRQMSAVFAAPRWLRDIGVASWLLVGLALLIVGLVALLAITSVIAEPVLIGLVLATVLTPVVSWLQRKGVPRVAGALLVLLGFVVLGVVILVRCSAASSRRATRSNRARVLPLTRLSRGSRRPASTAPAPRAPTKTSPRAPRARSPPSSKGSELPFRV